MLNFTYASVFIAVLTCNLIVMLLYVFFRSEKLMIRAGYQLLGCFAILTVLRFVFPLELPITTTISFPQSISWIISSLLKLRFDFLGITVTFWNLVVLCWGIGGLVYLIRYIRSVNHFLRFIKYNGTDVSDKEPYAPLMSEICSRLNIHKKIPVITLPGLQTPMVCRFFKPFILIPEKVDFDEVELYYTISHELSHVSHRDLLVKLFIQIIEIIYWWNPFCHFLRNQADLLLEMRIDKEIAVDRQQKKDYLNCLIKVAENTTKLQRSPIGISFCQNTSALSKRFHMLLHHDKNKFGKPINILLLLSVFGVYIASFFFIFESRYIPTEFHEEYLLITSESSYIINNGDKTYTLYYNDAPLETMNDLPEHYSYIKIYNSLEEAEKHAQ